MLQSSFLQTATGEAQHITTFLLEPFLQACRTKLNCTSGRIILFRPLSPGIVTDCFGPCLENFTFFIMVNTQVLVVLMQHHDPFVCKTLLMQFYVHIFHSRGKLLVRVPLSTLGFVSNILFAVCGWSLRLHSHTVPHYSFPGITIFVETILKLLVCVAPLKRCISRSWVISKHLCTEHKLFIDRTISGFEVLMGTPCTNCFSQRTCARMKLLFLHLWVASTSLCTYSIIRCTFITASISTVSKYEHSLRNKFLALALAQCRIQWS